MSLKEAVLAIAESMEEEVNQATDPTIGEKFYLSLLRSFYRELRTAVKASDSSQDVSILQTTTNPDYQNFLHIQKAKETVREEMQKKAKQEEAVGHRMVEATGGGVAEDSMVQVPNDMPVGAKTNIGGWVYILGEDQKLHSSEEETKKLTEQRMKQGGPS